MYQRRQQPRQPSPQQYRQPPKVWIPIRADVMHQTEKAILLAVQLENEETAEVWFPLSQVRISERGIAANQWILERRAEELEAPIAAAWPPCRICGADLDGQGWGHMDGCANMSRGEAAAREAAGRMEN